MEKSKLKKILSIFDEYGIPEEQRTAVFHAINEFAYSIPSDAINMLFAGATNNRYLEKNLKLFGISGLPEKLYPIIFREMRKVWESQGSFMDELKLPQMSQKTAEAFERLTRKAQSLYPNKDQAIIAIQLYRRLCYYYLNHTLEDNQKVIELLGSDSPNCTYGGFIELNFKKEEIEILSPLAKEIFELAITVEATDKVAKESVSISVEEPMAPQHVQELEISVDKTLPNHLNQEQADTIYNSILVLAECYAMLPGGCKLTITKMK